MSYCDNCIHQKVCRFTKDIKKHESAPVQYLSGYTDGPTAKYAVDCPYKQITMNWQEKATMIFRTPSAN